MTSFIMLVTLLSGKEIVQVSPSLDTCWKQAVKTQSAHKDVRSVECVPVNLG